MGVFSELSGPLAQYTADKSTPALAALGFFSFIVAAIVLNVLKQLLIKNPNEPPLVFHWVPFFGSTIVYGMDPYKFFFSNREKVRLWSGRGLPLHVLTCLIVWRCLYLYPAREENYRVLGYQGE